MEKNCRESQDSTWVVALIKKKTRRIPVLITSDAIKLKNRNSKNDICSALIITSSDWNGAMGLMYVSVCKKTHVVKHTIQKVYAMSPHRISSYHNTSWKGQLHFQFKKLYTRLQNVLYKIYTCIINCHCTLFQTSIYSSSIFIIKLTY